ncbi:coiled coil [Cryptosporidium sp. chipmunk genotype I]|uniref:coiled coil n=1 Tax=Cryptosporidium sp. chipmunk genotype I TaxID=1280935 RepID=UPI00351A132E|nr:coiled coil [Cryptosporidium sp. chipmunk genotype I]
MLKKIFGKKNEEGEDVVKPVKANLGEENKFYYNKELKSWVVRGEEHLVEQKQNLPPPPPMRPTTTDSGTRTESMTSFSSGSQSTGIRKSLYTSTPGLNIMKNSKEQTGGIIPAAGFTSAIANATLFGTVGTHNTNSAADNLDKQSRIVEPGRQDTQDLNDRKGIQEQSRVGTDAKGARRTSVQGKESGDHLELSPSSFEGYSGEISGAVHHFQEDQNTSIPSSVYTNFTNQSSTNTISITNRVLPPIPSLPNAAISSRDLTCGVSQRRKSVQDSPLSFISTPNVIQNPKDILGERMEEISAYQNQYIHQEISVEETCDEFDHNSMGVAIQGLNEQQENHMIASIRNQEDKMNSTISNSESDQTEILYTQNDMRQRQRIRPLSQRSAASSGISGLADKNEQIEVIKENMDINNNGASSEREAINIKESNLPKMQSSILELISFFGFRYDEKSHKLLDNLEFNENMSMNEQHYNIQKEDKKSLSQVCIEIKENKLKQMNFLVEKVFESLKDSSSEYDSLMEMILNIGNITNKTFQEISGTINTVMSNSDEIEKELIKTRGLYLDLVKKYKAIYKQYETDMVTLRSELENEKNMNITNSKEFEEKLKKLQDEFSSNEASNNELLHQYYSYIQNLQQQFEETQQNMQGRELKLKISEEEISKLKSEIEELRVKLEEKQGELILASERSGEYERENQRLRESNEELISLSKLSEENTRQERIVLIEEHKQELELMEKFSREQDEQINQLQKSIGDLIEERSELLNQSNQLSSEIVIIKTQIENLVDEKSKMEEEVLALISQNQDKSSRIAELENMIGAESQRMETVSKEMEELKELKSQMEQRIEEIEKEKIQTESELRLEKENLKESCERLSKELDMTLKNQELVEASKVEVESEKRKLMKELESKSEEYNKHVSWLEGEISRVDEEWRARQTHFEANYEQLYAQYMNLSSREGEIGALQERTKELELERVGRNEYISELEAKLNESQNDNRVSELEKRLEEIESQNQDKSDRLKESEEEILRSKRFISELEARLESEVGKNKSLSGEVESLQDVNGSYLARIQELEQRLESSEQYREYMSKLEQRTLGLESSLEEKCREYDSLEGQYTKLLRESKDFENSNSKEINHQMKLENEKLRETNEAVYIKLEAFSRDIDMLNNQLEWVRRYSPQVYEAMLENTYQYPNSSFGNHLNSGNEHEISDIAL